MTHQQPSKELVKKFEEQTIRKIGMTVFEILDKIHPYFWDTFRKDTESLLTSHSQAIRERVESFRRDTSCDEIECSKPHIHERDETFNRILDDILALLTDDKV